MLLISDNFINAVEESSNIEKLSIVNSSWLNPNEWIYANASII